MEPAPAIAALPDLIAGMVSSNLARTAMALYSLVMGSALAGPLQLLLWLIQPQTVR